MRPISCECPYGKVNRDVGKLLLVPIGCPKMIASARGPVSSVLIYDS